MRNLLTIGFTFIMLIANLHQSMSYAFFKINQPNISSEKCEMRRVEDNNCQGSCVLREMLQPSEERENPVSWLDLRLDEYLNNDLEEFSLNVFKPFVAKTGFNVQVWLDKTLVFKIWRPPQKVI